MAYGLKASSCDPLSIIVVGLCWIIMIIASAADSGPIWWIAIFSPFLQGINIFFFFGFNDKARLMWKNLFK